jgi:hypothetical protein
MLTKPGKDQIPLVVINLFQSLMACNFLRLGFTPPLITHAQGSPSHHGQTCFSPYWQKVCFLGTYLKDILSAMHVF